VSARWAAFLLGSAGLHAAALALLTFVAVKAGFAPALVVDLSAWEQGGSQRPADTPPRRVADDRAVGGRAAEPPRLLAAVPMISSAPAILPAAPASAIATGPLPAPSPSETRPSRALEGSEGVENPAVSAPGASVASSGPRGDAGGGTGSGAAGSAGAAPDGREGGKGLGVGGGSQLALALPGEGRGGAPAEYGPYLARFRQRVQDALAYPLAARRRGLSGTVELEVLIDPAGKVRRVEVSSSSSHALLDEAAVDAVRQMAPLPMPETLPARALRVKLPLVFELR